MEFAEKGAETMRWLAMFCFSVAGAVFALEYGAEWILLPLLVLVLILTGVALLQHKRKRMIALVLAVGISFGSFYTLLYDTLFIRPAQQYVDTEQTISVTLCAYPEEHIYGAKCVAYMDVGAAAPMKVQLYGDETLLSGKPGDRVTTDASIRSASLIRDEKITSFSAKGVHLLLYGRGELQIVPAEHLPVQYLPLQFSRLLQEKIEQIYDGEARILMTALLTGVRTEFDDALYSLLSETGLTHVTAVSGMHCVFLFAMIRMLIKNRRRATMVGLPVLFFFMLMVGVAPSVARSCFMLALLSIAPLLHRENDSITTMSFALLMILLHNPFAIASISLQLSFLSVAGILLFSERICRVLQSWFIRDQKRHNVLQVVFSAISVTCGASVFTIPLSAYYFDCVSLISPVSNLLCLWAISFAFGAGALSVAVSFLSVPIAGVIAILPAAALDYFMAVVRLLAEVPHHALYTSNPYLVYWLFYVYAMIGVLFLMKNRRTRTRLMAGGLASAALCLVIALPILANGRTSMTASVLNVGQGEAVLLSSGGQTALVDCGSSNSWINAGTVAANEINTLGQTELTYLILTHYHNDHANGLETLFSRVKVRYLVVPKLSDAESWQMQSEVLALAEQYQTEVLLLEAEEHIAMGKAELTIFPPMGTGSNNEEGLSLLCSCEGVDILVTGDMDGETEQVLLSSAVLPELEVLVVGHHGSKYSTSEALLETLSPETAVISVGSNSYGHPAAETLVRLEEAGADIRRTDWNGKVSILVY